MWFDSNNRHCSKAFPCKIKIKSNCIGDDLIRHEFR